VYFACHERDYVVELRKEFVAQINELEHRCIYNGHLPVLRDGERPLIVIHHDESTFYANADQSQYWSDGSTTVLKQKPLGQSIMVSDFIEEAGGDYLRHNMMIQPDCCWKQQCESNGGSLVITTLMH